MSEHIEIEDIECEFSVQHLQDDDYAQDLIAEIANCRERIAKFEKLVSENENEKQELRNLIAELSKESAIRLYHSRQEKRWLAEEVVSQFIDKCDILNPEESGYEECSIEYWLEMAKSETNCSQCGGTGHRISLDWEDVCLTCKGTGKKDEEV